MSSSLIESRIAVAAGADEAFALGLAVLGRSVYEHRPAGTEVDFFVFDAGLEAPTKARLEESWAVPGFRTHWLGLDTEFLASCKLDRYRFPLARCVPLVLDNALPLDLKRVLFLDADIVARSDLTPLWEADLAGRTVGAVQDTMIPFLRNQFIPEGVDTSGQAANFNSGVLVIDLERWRRKRVGQRAIDFAEAYRQHFWSSDQQALNCALVADWKGLPLIWNRMSHIIWIPSSHRYCTTFSRSDFAEAISEPRILHFAGADKPWHPTYQGDFAEAFFDQLDRTAWAGWRPEPLPLLRRLEHVLVHAPHRRYAFVLRGLRLAAQEGLPRWPWIRSAGDVAVRFPWTLLTFPARRLWSWLRRRRSRR